MKEDDQSKNIILDTGIMAFLKAADKLTQIFESLDTKSVSSHLQLNLNDDFSKILMYVYPGFLEHFETSQVLARNKLFFSLVPICRSLLDLEITLRWISSLEPKKRNKATQVYLQFNGTHPETKKAIRDWQRIIDDKFSCEKAALNLKIDLSLEILEGQGPVSNFAFLSKILHWNPQVLKDIIVRDSQGVVTYKKELLSLVTLHMTLKSICSFINFFVGNFYPDRHESISSILMNVMEEFQNCIAQQLKLRVKSLKAKEEEIVS